MQECCSIIAHMKRPRKSATPRRPARYTQAIPLRVLAETSDAFARSVRPNETLSEAARRIFTAGLAAEKTAKGPEKNPETSSTLQPKVLSESR